MGKLDDDRREWERLARMDAMWAVYSDPERRGSWAVDEFLESGRSEVGGLLAGLAEQGLDPARDRALDFGCGLGRLSRALAEHFGEVVGVDISAEMVRRATELHVEAANCHFVANAAADLARFGDGEFDFVLSLIALQHVSSPGAIAGYLAEFARVTRPGGVIVVQVPERVGRRVAWHPLRVVNATLRRVPGVPDALLDRLAPWSMRLTALAPADVGAALRSRGAAVVTSFPDRRTGSDAVPSRLYVAQSEM